MDKKQQGLFYVGAAIYLNLDADEVDRDLALDSISAQDDTAAECIRSIRTRYPLRYTLGVAAGPFPDLPETEL